MFYELSLVDEKKLPQILDAVNAALLGTEPYKIDQCSVKAVDCLFYHGCALIEVTNQITTPNRQHHAIYDGQTAHIIDYKSETLYALNARLVLMLDEQNVHDYVRFFFHFSSGPHGRFLLVENVDDIAWKDDPPPNARQAIGSMINPLSLTEQDAQKRFIFTAYMVFKDNLFKCDIAVQMNGTVRMSNEQLLIEDIPIIDDVVGL